PDEMAGRGAQLLDQPGRVVRQRIHVIAGVGDRAAPLAAEIEGDAAVVAAERLDLEAVHGPAPEETVGEDDRDSWSASVLVMQLPPLDLHARHGGEVARAGPGAHTERPYGYPDWQRRPAPPRRTRPVLAGAANGSPRRGHRGGPGAARGSAR